MEQLVARRAHNPKVVGSSPAPATRFGGIAQLARAFGSYPKGRRFKSYFRYQSSYICMGSLCFLYIYKYRCYIVHNIAKNFSSYIKVVYINLKNDELVKPLGINVLKKIPHESVCDKYFQNILI